MLLLLKEMKTKVFSSLKLNFEKKNLQNNSCQHGNPAAKTLQLNGLNQTHNQTRSQAKICCNWLLD
jgi:hypothetical protein